MENSFDWCYHHKIQLLATFILIISIIGGIFCFTFVEASSQVPDEKEEVTSKEQIEELKEEPIEGNEKEAEKEDLEEYWSIDIKGQINNPGVYQVKENTRIHEVITLAGGLKKEATTENINLSKKVTDEMVIYIYSKEEYKTKTNCNIENKYAGEISSEIEKKESVVELTPSKNQENKISLNKATLEELMTLEGIGEIKAKSIMAYRAEKNGFKSIDELKNISGIGEALYEKIKDNLTL